MLGSPGGRRRRLIQAFAPSNADNNYYTSVPSSSSGSSFRRRRPQGKVSGDARKRPNAARGGNTTPTGFRPINPTAEHGYRIDVARDGSMITAVPIDEQPLRGGGSGRYISPQHPLPSASPILFGQPRSSPVGSDGSTTFSTQALLEARGKQRHKMKRMRPGTRTNTTAASRHSPNIASNHDAFPHDPFNNVVHTARDKLKQAKGFLAFTGTNNKKSIQLQEQEQQQTVNQQLQNGSKKPPIQPPTPPKSRPRKTKVRWDLSPKRQREPEHPPHLESEQSVQVAHGNSGNLEDASFSSFPILSPNHKFDDSNSPSEEEKKFSDEKVDAPRISNAATNPNRNGIEGELTSNQKGGTHSFEVILQQRMAEIQSQQRELAAKISKRDVIKGTLVSAIDENVEKNRKQMLALEEELKEIQWHLELDSRKKQQQQKQQKTNKKKKDKPKVDVREVRISRSPSGAYDMGSVGDPSITADTDSVDALYRKDKARTRAATGLDPPARPSPRTIKEMHALYLREAKEPDGPRISAVLRGDEALGFTSNARMIPSEDYTDREERFQKSTIPRKSAPTNPPQVHPNQSMERPPLHHGEHQQLGESDHAWHRRRMARPQRQKLGKFVHFNLPKENYSDELKFESTMSTDSPSADFKDIKDEDITEDISWKEEHFDVEEIDEDTGSFINAEHHDHYQWKDKERHVVVSEHYSSEDHHHRHFHEVINETPNQVNRHKNFNGNRGVSSDSVETNPDLSFIHAIAAVVIQTAVRRFLAEIVVEERLYAVNVIQTAICNWMARKGNPYYNTGVAFHNDEQSSDRIFHNEQYQPIRQGREPFQRAKRVMFEDDYNEFLDYAATEIQRCFRGWWARDGLEVDHFAATTIQRVFRGWWTREGMEVDQYCAIEIQRIVRGYLARMSYIYDLYCIIVAQSVVRRYLAFYTSAVRLANILYIQAIYRGYTVREELRRYVRNGQEVAATFIQSQWRSYDAQMNYINTLADILIVQSVVRRWLTLRKMRKLYGRKPKNDKVGSGQPRTSNNRNNSAATKRDTHAVWQQHRLNVVSKPPSPKYSHPEGFDVFHRDSVGGEGWYDGNKSEASDMLKSWKGRKSR